MTLFNRVRIPLRSVARHLAFGLTWCLAFSVSHAQEWLPTKTIRIVVPIVGSTNDVIARLVAPELQKALGQTVVVENKGGAGGTIGAMDVVKAAPDGHTLLVGFNGPIAVNVTLMPKLPYDPQKDLAPITLAVTAPQYLAVHPSLPVRNVAELVALAKTRKLAYASISPGSASHLTFEMLKTASGMDIVHVPYKGSGLAVTDLIGGQVDAGFFVPGNIQQFAKDGRARLIASSGDKRMLATPNLPTLVEQGYPGLVALTWIGFLAPGGTPKNIIERYNKELVRILTSAELKPKLEALEVDVVAGSPKAFADLIASEIPRWGKVVRDTGAKAE